MGSLSPNSTAVAVGYIRVSTSEQGATGASLSAQRTVIEQEAARRGWDLKTVFEDIGMSGKSLRGRPALARCLTHLRNGDSTIMLVAKLDRLSRSVADFATLLERSRREGWGLVALDLGVDTTTPSGELVANVMAAVAQWERRAIGQRTKEGLAARRQQGIRLGRPPVLEQGVLERIVDERLAGLTLSAIAAGLNEDRVPTAHGGTVWRPSSVRSILRSSRGQIALSAERSSPAGQ